MKRLLKVVNNFYSEILHAPSEIPATPMGNSQIFLALVSSNSEGARTEDFKIKNSRPLFTVIFKPKIVISRVKILVYFSSHSRWCVTVLLVNWSLLVSCGHMHSTVWSSLCFWKSKTLSKIWKYNRELYERYIEWELTVILRPHRGNYLS